MSHKLVSLYIGDGEYYTRTDADNVIAELKNKINEVRTELELWRDGSIISELHQKELDGKRHSDYKRCVAMAMCCAAERDIFNLTPKVTKVEFFARWHKRWLEISTKFKEAK